MRLSEREGAARPEGGIGVTLLQVSTHSGLKIPAGSLDTYFDRWLGGNLHKFRIKELTLQLLLRVERLFLLDFYAEHVVLNRSKLHSLFASYVAASRQFLFLTRDDGLVVRVEVILCLFKFVVICRRFGHVSPSVLSCRFNRRVERHWVEDGLVADADPAGAQALGLELRWRLVVVIRRLWRICAAQLRVRVSLLGCCTAIHRPFSVLHRRAVSLVGRPDGSWRPLRRRRGLAGLRPHAAAGLSACPALRHGRLLAAPDHDERLSLGVGLPAVKLFETLLASLEQSFEIVSIRFREQVDVLGNHALQGHRRPTRAAVYRRRHACVHVLSFDIQSLLFKDARQHTVRARLCPPAAILGDVGCHKLRGGSSHAMIHINSTIIQ